MLDEALKEEKRKQAVVRIKNIKLLLPLIVGLFFLNGCALLQIPGALIGTAAKLATKVPWWMFVL